MLSFQSIYFKIIKKLRFYYSKNSQIDKTSKINAGSEIVNSVIGKYSYCGYDCKILDSSIGKFCSIASDVFIGCERHPIDWVSTSPVFLAKRNTLNKNLGSLKFDDISKTNIGNDVWIGQRVIIKSGVKIGDGAVIGMGSVVTHDVEPYTIVAGCPAKIIRKRFADDIIKELLNIKWWELDDKTLRDCSKYVDNVKEFIRIINSKIDGVTSRI